MKGTADKGVRMPVVICRTDLKRCSDKHLANHGFFNARNSALPELPLRSWGTMPVAPGVASATQARPKQ